MKLRKNSRREVIKIELFRLFGTVLIDDKEAIESLKKVDEKGKNTKTSLQDIADKGAKIGAAVVAGTGVAIGGMLALADSTSETAGKWLELSQRTGIGIESLERWGYAATQSGADIDKLEVGMKKLSSNIVDATDKSGKSRDAFSALGISMQDLKSMTPEQTFDAVMAKLADMPDSAQKNVLGNQLLGKSYTELKPLLAEGSEGISALKNRADELGIVMSGKSVVAAENFGDTIDDVKMSFDGAKNKIVADMIPTLSNMLNWFIDKMPVIEETVGKAFGLISDTIGFITDHSNILIPVLAGLLAAFTAMKIVGVINGLMAAYTAFTTTATGVQIGLNAAMLANPIGLIIIAIAALIAIGVALYMNWDKVKAGAQSLWNSIKSVFTGIKDDITDKLTAVKTIVSAVFDKIGDVMSKPFENGMNIIRGIIDKIKSFLDFDWKFPKLKMPHFSVTGSMNPMKWITEGVPKLSVDWYAKGGIFSKPTIFNTPYGLKGVGDASSPEVVAPLNDLYGMIYRGMSEAIAPLLLRKENTDGNIIVESNLYTDSEKLYSIIQKGKAKVDRRNQTLVARRV